MAKEGVLYVRMDDDDVNTFKKKCKDFSRKHYDVVREMIEAFNEGRLTIKPTEGQLKQKEMYNVD